MIVYIYFKDTLKFEMCLTKKKSLKCGRHSSNKTRESHVMRNKCVAVEFFCLKNIKYLIL